jgi:hypothetical protein
MVEDLARKYWLQQRYPGRSRRPDDPLDPYPASRPGWWDEEEAQLEDPGCDCSIEGRRRKHRVDAEDHNRRLELYECLACGARWCRVVERTDWCNYNGDETDNSQ